jgi:hypothetical protein
VAGRFVDLFAEGHGAEADVGDEKAAAAQTAVLHGVVVLQIGCWRRGGLVNLVA